jgi:hypothetical protein
MQELASLAFDLSPLSPLNRNKYIVYFSSLYKVHRMPFPGVSLVLYDSHRPEDN